MLSVPLILEGIFGIAFKGDVPMIIAAASLMVIGYLALGALLQLLLRDLPTALGSPASSSRRHSVLSGSDFRSSP